MSGTTEINVPDTLHIEGEAAEPQEQSERKLSAREEAMAAIARRAEERRGMEIAQGAVYDAEARERGEALPPPTFEQEEPEEEHIAEAHPAEPRAKAPAPDHATPAQEAVHHAPVPQLRTINVNGTYHQVTDAQYEQLAQMGVMAGLALAQQPAVPHPTPEPPPAAAPHDILSDERAEEFARHLQFGTTNDAAKGIQGLVRDVMATAPRIDQETLVQQATQRAIQQIEGQRTVATIKSEFPQIFTDPALMAMARVKSEQLHQQAAMTGQRLSEIEVYREAGRQVYDMLKLPRPGIDNTPTQPAPQAAPLTVQPRADIEVRKRAAPRNTQPVDRRSVAPPPTPQAASASDIVAWIASKRGQQLPR